MDNINHQDDLPIYIKMSNTQIRHLRMESNKMEFCIFYYFHQICFVAEVHGTTDAKNLKDKVSENIFSV